MASTHFNWFLQLCHDTDTSNAALTLLPWSSSHGDIIMLVFYISGYSYTASFVSANGGNYTMSQMPVMAT